MSDARVRRPLGLTIAIYATAIIYGLLPVLEVYFLRRLNATAEEALVPGGVGITTWNWLAAAFGGVVLVVCVLAWWGRPPWIRFVLMGILLFLTAVYLFRIVEAWNTEPDPITGGQVQETWRDMLNCQLPVLIVVPLYVVWYLNRAPARAFYRRVPLESLDKVHEDK
jgi:hypothetical protein